MLEIVWTMPVSMLIRIYGQSDGKGKVESAFLQQGHKADPL